MSEQLDIAQVCADRGIAPGGTKGAARHLAGIAGGLARLGNRVTTYAERAPVGPHPVRVADLCQLKESRPDVVYERYSLSSGVGLSHAREIGASFVLEVNAPLVEEAQRHRPGTVDRGAAERERNIVAEADLVVVVSRPLEQWVRELRDGPTTVIQNGFDPSWFPNGANQQLAEQRLVFLGHPKPWHGANRLPGLIDQLGRRGHRPTLLVVGGGAGATELIEDARDLGVEGQIQVTGPVSPPEASRLVASATIGLAPYPRQSSFYFSPLKIVDYLAAGLAIVSTDQGDIAELVADAGVVVDDPDDDKAIVDAIASLLDDHALRAAMGRSGRQRAFEALTWDHAARQTIAAIDLTLTNERAKTAVQQ